MKKTALLLAFLMLVSPVLAGSLSFSPSPLKSDPTVDDRSYFDGWVFTRHFKANEPMESVFEEYTLMPGETLWSVAAKPEIYGDSELYPLLAAANPLYFKKAASDREWLVIRIPRDVPAELAAEARVAAWSPVYADNMGMKFSKEVYVAWLGEQKGPIQIASAR